MAISGDQQMPQMQPPSLLYFLDLNTVFTISFAVFFLSAGVYFVLRSCCRSWRDSDQEVEEDGDAQRAAETKPACLTQVRAISVVLFDAGGGEAEENCPVCLEQHERGAELRVMPQCGHAFHRACVDLWLLTKSSFCPICRVRVVERGVEPIDDWYPDYQLRRKPEGSRRISCPPKHTLHIVIAEISKDERLHNFIEEDHWWPQTIAKPVSKRPRVSRT